jgi:DNA-binding CsgD family transcriptional regulator
MDDAGYERFLDLTYDAAISPDRWGPVVERLAGLVGGLGGFISRLNVRDGSGAMEMAGYDPRAADQYFAHYASTNPLTIVPDARAYFRDWRPRILVDEDLVDKSELTSGEFYNDYMRANDTHSCMMIRLAAAAEEVVAITIGRPFRSGGFGEEDLAAARRIHPHLLRAFSLGHELAGSRSAGEELEALLDNSRSGFVLTDGEGRVRRMNRPAEDLISRQDGLRLSGGRLSATSLVAAERLRRLIGEAAAADAERRGGGEMTLTSPGRRFPLSISVNPMHVERAKVFGGDTEVLITITDPLVELTVPERRLADLFGLTRAERRVAQGLLEGQTPREIAAAVGVSFFTVRGHLVRIFEKTGTSRQAELVRLLIRAADG